jgi:transcriptional regulator with XRE-family HTH domain
MEKINELIKNIRKRAGMTQLEFAILIDSTRGNVAKYETGVTTPPGDVMLRILEHREEV